MIQTEISESNLKDDKSLLLEKKINSIDLIKIYLNLKYLIYLMKVKN